MTDNSITIGTLIIHEPVTVFTDIIITILCLFFVSRLKAHSPATGAWKGFFIFIGLSTLAGAASHGFFAVHEGPAYKTFWLSMQLLNGLAVFSAQLATLRSVLRDHPQKNILNKVFMIQLVLFCILVPLLQNFLLVVIDCALGLIPVMIWHLRRRESAFRKIAYGILVSFLTGIVHGAKLSLHTWFNHNDIAHLLIMISLYLMYSGVKKSHPAMP